MGSGPDSGMIFALVSVTGSATGSTTGSGATRFSAAGVPAVGDGFVAFSAARASVLAEAAEAGSAFVPLLGLDLFAAALVGSADALADAAEAISDDPEALAGATDAFPGVADALAGATGAVGAAAGVGAAAAAGVGWVSASLGFVAGPFASGLGSIGASALRLAEAVVFFVVVGFFAIAAHLGDLSASNKGVVSLIPALARYMRDTGRNMPQAGRPLNRWLL